MLIGGNDGNSKPWNSSQLGQKIKKPGPHRGGRAQPGRTTLARDLEVKSSSRPKPDDGPEWTFRARPCLRVKADRYKFLKKSTRRAEKLRELENLTADYLNLLLHN